MADRTHATAVRWELLPALFAGERDCVEGWHTFHRQLVVNQYKCGRYCRIYSYRVPFRWPYHRL